MSEAPTHGPRAPTRPPQGNVLSVTTVTDEELAHLDFSSWKADQWLEDAVELEMRFGIGPGTRPKAIAPTPRPMLYRVMEWLLVCNLTLVVVMLLLYGKGSDPVLPAPTQNQPGSRRFSPPSRATPDEPSSSSSST